MQNRTHKINKLFFDGLINWASFCLNKVFIYLGLKKEKNFWGVVYDSQTKQPIDPAVVKIVRAGTNMEVQTGITDLGGRYGFLVGPGKYKIIAKKQNYLFPTEMLKGSDDGIYKHIYKGEFFEVKGGSEVVAPNIPMDSINTDWNQEAKKKYFKAYPYVRYSILYLASWVYRSLFVISVLFISRDFFPDLTIQKNIWTYIFIIFLLLWLFSKIIPDIRLYGQILDKKTKSAVSGLYLEVHSPLFQSVVFGKTQTNEDGKFFLRASPGSYRLLFFDNPSEKQRKILGAVDLKIGGNGLLNKKFTIDLT